MNSKEVSYDKKQDLDQRLHQIKEDDLADLSGDKDFHVSPFPNQFPNRFPNQFPNRFGVKKSLP